MKSLYLLFLLTLLSCVTLNKSGAAAKKGLSKQISSKRILSEWKEICRDGIGLDVPFNYSSPTECGIRLSPLKNNLLEWHFSFQGVEGSNYENGIYHGKIKLHPDYPQKAPAISMLTPSGRWEVNTDICLSATAHHPETWNQHWNLRTLVMSLRGFMTTQPRELGSIKTDPIVRRQLAQQSRLWVCPECNTPHSCLGREESFSKGAISQSLLVKPPTSRINNRMKETQNKNRRTSQSGDGKGLSHRNSQLKKLGFTRVVAKQTRRIIFPVIIGSLFVQLFMFIFSHQF